VNAIVELRVKKSKQLQLSQTVEGTRGVLFGEQEEPFITQPWAGQAINETGLRCLPQQLLSIRVKPTFESLFESDRTKDARGVVFKTFLV